MPVKQRVRGPRVRRWTVKEFYRLADCGVLRPDERAELIDGVIYKMFPINARHAGTVDWLRFILEQAFGPGYYARLQQPLHFGPRSEPQPDLAMVAGSPKDYLVNHPTTALLIAEVSFKTLWYDRRRKGGLYARAGLEDYWIVNLKKRQLEVYRSPMADSTHHYGHRYASTTILTDKDTVTPLAAPNARILVADLLP